MALSGDICSSVHQWHSVVTFVAVVLVALSGDICSSGVGGTQW